MFKRALGVGLLPWEFWELTPLELAILVEERTRQRYEEASYIAWLTAMLSRQKRIPPLERLLKRRKERKEYKNPEERKKELEELIRRLG